MIFDRITKLFGNVLKEALGNIKKEILNKYFVKRTVTIAVKIASRVKNCQIFKNTDFI